MACCNARSVFHREGLVCCLELNQEQTKESIIDGQLLHCRDFLLLFGHWFCLAKDDHNGLISFSCSIDYAFGLYKLGYGKYKEMARGISKHRVGFTRH